MWYKVAWLFVWTTLAFWAGCAGENQNYEINKQDVDTFEAPPDGGPASPGGSAGSTDEPAALTGLTRENWQPMTIGPVDGRAPHHPRYFGSSWGESFWGGDWRAVSDRPSPLLRQANLEAEAWAATGGNREKYTAGDLSDTVLLPVKFGVDLVSLPVSVITTPPTTVHYTPSP